MNGAKSPVRPFDERGDARSTRSGGSQSSPNRRSSSKPIRSSVVSSSDHSSSSRQQHQQQQQQQARMLQQQQQQQRTQTSQLQQHPPAIGPAASNVSSHMASSSQNTSASNPLQPPTNTTTSTQGEGSPLPPMVQRSLGDRSNEKRKYAALEIEALIKSLTEANNFTTVHAVISVLSKDFCTSMNSNYRKGGLVGLAATAIGLHAATGNFLNVLLPPVLHAFDDPDARVRYYACESIYNMAKVSRQSILRYFNPIFEGLTKLFADVDGDVKNGANLLDRLVKDVVTEADSDSFQVDCFLPVMQNYIRRTNPYIRALIVGWITLLDSLPDVSMLDYLPDFLDGLFNMLSDSNKEIRQAADSALSDFLRELQGSQVVEFGPIISILVFQCQSKERLNRLTAITWLAELTHHPLSGGDALLPFLPDILSAILFCISDGETEIKLVSDKTNDDLLELVRDTVGEFELRPLLGTLTSELLEKEDVPTKMAALRWINMLMEKRMYDMQVFTVNLLPVLLRTLSDPSDPVVLLDLQVLSRISLAVAKNLPDRSTAPIIRASKRDTPKLRLEEHQTSDGSSFSEPEEAQFQLVLNAILNLFAQDRQLLETRGSLIIRKLCVLLNAKAVYIRMAETLSSYEIVDANDKTDQASTLQFISTMVQTLNLILLTASELHDLRSILANSFEDIKQQSVNQQYQQQQHQRTLSSTSSSIDDEEAETGVVFATLFHCWCHNPVATFSLCLLAKAYDLSFELVKRFSDMENVSVGFLMQIDKLVHLLESPIFVHLRLQLLNVEAPTHAHLLKSIYGILMCLPQGEAFRLLNGRLTTVCNLRDNLGVSSHRMAGNKGDELDFDMRSIVSRRGLDMDKILGRFDSVTDQHREARARAPKMAAAAEQAAFTSIFHASSSSPNKHHSNHHHGNNNSNTSNNHYYASPQHPGSVASSVGRNNRATPIITNTERQGANGAPPRISVQNQSLEHDYDFIR